MADGVQADGGRPRATAGDVAASGGLDGGRGRPRRLGPGVSVSSRIIVGEWVREAKPAEVSKPGGILSHLNECEFIWVEQMRKKHITF